MESYPDLPQSPPDGASLRENPRRISIQALLGQGRELVILHNGREYRLRITQNGKLILTA